MEDLNKLVAELCDRLLAENQGKRTTLALNAASILLEFALVDRQRADDPRNVELISDSLESLRAVRAPNPHVHTNSDFNTSSIN